MRKHLKRLKRNFKLIYIDLKGSITERKVEDATLHEKHFNALDVEKQERRNFNYDRVIKINKTIYRQVKPILESYTDADGELWTKCGRYYISGLGSRTGRPSNKKGTAAVKQTAKRQDKP